MRKAIVFTAVLFVLTLITASTVLAGGTKDFYVTVETIKTHYRTGQTVEFEIRWLEYAGSGHTSITYYITEYGKNKKLDTNTYGLYMERHGLPDQEPAPYDESAMMYWESYYSDGTLVKPGHYEVHVTVESTTYNPITGKFIINKGTASDGFYLLGPPP